MNISHTLTIATTCEKVRILMPDKLWELIKFKIAEESGKYALLKAKEKKADLQR